MWDEQITPVIRICLWFAFSKSKHFMFLNRKGFEISSHKELFFCAVCILSKTLNRYWQSLQIFLLIFPLNVFSFINLLYWKLVQSWPQWRYHEQNILWRFSAVHVGFPVFYIFAVYCCRFSGNIIVYKYILKFKSVQPFTLRLNIFVEKLCYLCSLLFHNWPVSYKRQVQSWSSSMSVKQRPLYTSCILALSSVSWTNMQRQLCQLCLDFSHDSQQWFQHWTNLYWFFECFFSFNMSFRVIFE